MGRSGSALSSRAAGSRPGAGYRVAFFDWLGCATAGAAERAAQCAKAEADGLSGRVLAAAVAGHVLDFDDTYVPGLSHLSAPTAPVALVVGAELDASLTDVIAAYAGGFEAMGALARRSHPALYKRGWHPTAVCGAFGAAVTAASLLGHEGDDVVRNAVRLALAQAGGLRRSFGSDAKAIQVGAAAATGLTATRLALRGATATPDLPTGPGGFEHAFGGAWFEPGDGSDGRDAVAENWIKAYPCCLQTHSSIEAAARARQTDARQDGPLTVTVHPRARQAAPYDDVDDGLAAKFSIPYTVAYTLLHGPPLEPACFDRVDDHARALAAERITLREDDSLPETGAELARGGHEPVRVRWAIGSPANPMSDDQLAAKLRRLAGNRLDAVVEGADLTAREAVHAAGLD
jgi:2-methylcitrate dehydratase PrpD